MIAVNSNHNLDLIMILLKKREFYVFAQNFKENSREQQIT